MNEADMGDFEVTRGIANGGVATTRIPTQKSVLCEGHAGEDFNALGEGDVLGKGCDNVCSSHLVQNVAGLAQEMRKGLTIFAVAHAPARFLGVADVAFQSPAPAPQWMVHVWSLLNAARPSHAVQLYLYVKNRLINPAYCHIN
jgi:hypothetical protein